MRRFLTSSGGEPAAEAAGEDTAAGELSRIPPELADLAGGYLERRRGDAETLRQAAADGAFEPARRLGHNMKGSGAGYGFERVSELGLRIEQAAQRGDAAEIERCARELSEYAERVLRALD